MPSRVTFVNQQHRHTVRSGCVLTVLDKAKARAFRARVIWDAIPDSFGDDLWYLVLWESLAKQRQRFSDLRGGRSHEAVEPLLVGHGRDLLAGGVGCPIAGGGLDLFQRETYSNPAARLPQVQDLCDSDRGRHNNSGCKLMTQLIAAFYWIDQVSVRLDNNRGAWPSQIQHRKARIAPPPGVRHSPFHGPIAVPNGEMSLPGTGDRHRFLSSHGVGDRRHYYSHPSGDPVGLLEDRVDFAAFKQVNRPFEV